MCDFTVTIDWHIGMRIVNIMLSSDGSIYPIESISTIFCRIETYRNRRYFPGHPNDFGTQQLGSNISNFTWIKRLSQSRRRRLLSGRLTPAGRRGRQTASAGMCRAERPFDVAANSKRLPSVVERGGDATVDDQSDTNHVVGLLWLLE